MSGVPFFRRRIGVAFEKRAVRAALYDCDADFSCRRARVAWDADMPSSTIYAVAGLLGGSLLLATAHLVARKAGKPRFVVTLCVVAVAVALAELREMIVSSGAAYGHVLFGMELSGTPALVVGLIDIGIYMVGAFGLWTLKPWARLAAMAYLLYLLASFVIWGVRDAGGQGVVVVMAWQMFVLPFITFSLMYLQQGASHFGVGPSGGEGKTGWLY